MVKKHSMAKMFEDFEKELLDLDIINPILCPLCNKSISRTKMGKGYSIGEVGFEMHITCVNKLPARSE